MSNVADMLQVAAKEIGYYAPSDPEPGSKYGRWMADVTGETWLRGSSKIVWWCAIFVSWVFSQAGIATQGLLPSYNCDQIRSRARAKGWVISSKYEARPGDIVLFDWGRDGSCDHIGIVEKNNGTYVTTIEGNTSSGTAGSQSAGNGVWRRTRAWGSVACVIRVPVAGAVSSPVVTQQTVQVRDKSKDLLAVDGLWGYSTSKALQAYGKTIVDGIVSSQWVQWKPRLKACTQGWEFVSNPQGSPTIKTVQKLIGVTPDGIFGKDSINALIRWAGGTPDGVLDLHSYSVKQLQRWLNKQKVA